MGELKILPCISSCWGVGPKHLGTRSAELIPQLPHTLAALSHSVHCSTWSLAKATGTTVL